MALLHLKLLGAGRVCKTPYNISPCLSVFTHAVYIQYAYVYLYVCIMYLYNVVVVTLILRDLPFCL